jgi:hypothetical protein
MDMPWIITFGPLSDDEEWEPVVCGPYERPHALSLAESVVADEDLMAVVEPLLPHVSVDEIRAEIAAARIATGDEEAEAAEYAEDLEYEEIEEAAQAHREPTAPPSEDEVRAGMSRIAARLGR